MASTSAAISASTIIPTLTTSATSSGIQVLDPDWQAYVPAVKAAHLLLSTQLLDLDPAYVTPLLPMDLDLSTTGAATCFAVAIEVNQTFADMRLHLADLHYHQQLLLLQIQLLHLQQQVNVNSFQHQQYQQQQQTQLVQLQQQVTALMQQIRADLPAAPPAAPPTAPPAAPPIEDPPPWVVEFITALQSARLAAPAHPRRIKISLPKKFNGSLSQCNKFLAECDNYFALNPMGEEQKIRFTLQLLEKGANKWKELVLLEFAGQHRPQYLVYWEDFKDKFRLRFEDMHERERFRVLQAESLSKNLY